MEKRANKFKSEYQLCGLRVLAFFNKHILLIIAILVTLIALAIRYAFVLYPTNDVAGIVFSWMKNIQKVGFTKFWTVDNDYLPFYMFMIDLLCLLPNGQEITLNGFTFYQNWMYYLKTIFFITDILSAFGFYLIVKRLTQDKTKAVLAYCLFLALPVELTNSAVWGNCDSFYFCAFVYIIYFTLKKKDGLVYYLLGVAFALKMQAVFIFPFIVYLILNRKLKLWPIVFFFVGWLASYLPSWCFGAPFSQPFMAIQTQVGRFSDLTLGCANMWHLMNFSSGAMSTIRKGATLFGLLFIGLCLALVYLRKISLTETNLVLISVFLIGIVPFFLPYMHERYFYPLEALVVVFALLQGKRYWMIAAMQVSGGISYYHYLSGKYFISSMGEDSVSIASAINLVVLGVILYDLYHLEKGPSPKEESLLLTKEADDLKKQINSSKDSNQTVTK
ncbi:MAG: hypothetical protein LKJ88_03880 [Bacilli bacterium]|jgi:Gpi18-like mannosyltransferase|nr:hypothetical protein [Bacilli bacterium]